MAYGIASIPDDSTKPKKPALYRAGQAVGAVYDAANNEATAAHNAIGNAVDSGVTTTKLGIANFVRGVQNKPALDTLPADPAPASAAPSAGIATPPPLFNQNAAQLRFRGATPLVPPDPPTTGSAINSTAGATTPTLKAPGIDSGVTLGDGRTLNYGAMVNGVPTFSDGSGGMPATMTKQDIASLGDRLNTVPAASFTRPGAGVLASAAGLAPVSTEGQVATLVRNAQGPKFGITPDMLAASDNNAVASGDWRSAAGTAAHNLQVAADAPGSYLQRRAALEDLSSFRGATAKAGQQAVDNAATLTRTGIAGQNALDVANLQGQYGLADTRLKSAAELALRKPDQVTLADGTVGLIQPDGSVTRAIGADGKPVQVPMTKNGALTEKDINDAAIKLLPQILGVDPTTGMIKDPSAPGGYRQATQAEITDGMTRARALASGQSVASAGTPSQSAIAYLKANPSLRSQFDAKYGQGAAAKVLGG